MKPCNVLRYTDFLFLRPLMKKQCKAADRVRSLCYNHQRNEIAVISLNGYIHCWNALKFKQVSSDVWVKLVVDANTLSCSR